MTYNTSGTAIKKTTEEGKLIPAVTLFASIGIAEDLSKTQFLLCGEIKEELKALKQSIDEIPFQELSKQVKDLTKNLELRMCSLELTYKTLKDIILQRTKQQSQLDSSLLEKWNPSDTVSRYRSLDMHEVDAQIWLLKITLQIFFLMIGNLYLHNKQLSRNTFKYLLR